MLSVIVPTYSRFDALIRCINSLLRQRTAPVQIIIVDNASPAGVGEKASEIYGNRIEVVRNSKNLFYAGAANIGVDRAEYPLVAVLNDDAWVSDTWSEQILETFDSSAAIGSVATLVLSAANPQLVDSAGDHLARTGYASNMYWRQSIRAVPKMPVAVFSTAGSCAVYRREAFHEVGGFDSDFVGYFEDIDLGFRLQLAGFTCRFNPACIAFHEGGGTYKTRLRAGFLSERNMAWNLLKNMPSQLLRESLWPAVSAQLHPAPINGGGSSIAWGLGKAAAALALPSVLAKRAVIQNSRVVSDEYIRSILTSGDVGPIHL